MLRLIAGVPSETIPLFKKDAISILVYDGASSLYVYPNPFLPPICIVFINPFVCVVELKGPKPN